MEFKRKKSITRRDFLKAAGLAATSSILAACGAPPTSPPETKPGAEEAVATDPPAAPEPTPTFRVDQMGSGNVVINMWDGIGASDGDILSAMINDFTTENPDIAIKRQIMPWDTYFDKLAAATIAGSGGPDFFV